MDPRPVVVDEWSKRKIVNTTNLRRLLVKRLLGLDVGMNNIRRDVTLGETASKLDSHEAVGRVTRDLDVIGLLVSQGPPRRSRS